MSDRSLIKDAAEHARRLNPQPDTDHPTLLAAVLAEQGVAQADLARRTNLSTKHVNLLCQGRARMSVDVALRLEMVLGVDAAEWMRAYTETWITEQRDAVQLAVFQQQLAWWKKSRADDLAEIDRLTADLAQAHADINSNAGLYFEARARAQQAEAELLISRTSLGTPEVRAIAALTPPEDVAAILRQVREIEDAEPSSDGGQP